MTRPVSLVLTSCSLIIAVGVAVLAVLNLKGVRKGIHLLPQFRNEADALDLSVAAWEPAAGDFADALLVANATYALVPHILGDDIDLVTFDGITVYTANRTAIKDAAAAGRLVT
jgi:hypothetical protein